MSPLAGLGFVGMLAALAWFAWCLVRVLIGPSRGKALGRAGIAVLVFIGSGAFAGWNLAPSPHVAAGDTQMTASTQQQAAIPAAQPAGTPPATQPLPRLAISGRYQTAPTLISLVVTGFEKGEEGEVEDFAQAECHGATFCSVGIWTSDELAPRKLKMTDSQVAARLVQYVHSPKTGIDRVLWNCALSPHNPRECLP